MRFGTGKRLWILRGAGAVAVGALAALTGCAGFFVNPTSTSPGGGSSTGDFVFVANQTSGSLAAFSVGSAGLTPLTGSPYALASGLSPASVAVSRANTYVYAGGTGAIQCFSIGTGGLLTLVSSSGASASSKFVSLATSPDGQWLLGLDGQTQTLYVYGINASTGALSLNSSVGYTAGGGGAVVPTQVRIAPNGAYVIAALGTGGDVVFSFNTTSGVAAPVATLAVPSGLSDNALAIDANDAYVYFARGGSSNGSSGVASYSLGTGGTLTLVQTLAASGNAPFSVILNSTGNYAYTANRADGTVSGYSVSGGMLTALPGSPYRSGSLATALVGDNSNKYVIAAAFGGSSDVTLYAIDALVTGQLDAIGTSASGTDPAGPTAIAATH